MSVLHVMNAAGTLPSSLADEMRWVLESTLKRHTAQLGLTGVDVALRVLPWGLPETGIHGFAPTGSYVELTVSPDNPEFLPGWRTELPATLAHELHHARRWRGPGYGRTLLEVLVTEGLAQHHERTERAGQAPPYAQAHIDRAALWQRARPLLQTSDFGFEAWFYGSGAHGLPRWAGYTLGFELVGHALKRLGGTAQDHVDTPAATVLNAAGDAFS